MSNDAELTIVDGGGVASAEGFQAGGVFAGIKTPGEDKYDLGLLFSERDCTVAGTFTRNSIMSPSVAVSKRVVERGTARAVIGNSGCANCSVGEQGLIDALDVAEIAANELGVDASEVLVASTGVIGVELPMNLIRDYAPQINVRGWRRQRSGESRICQSDHDDRHASQTDRGSVRGKRREYRDSRRLRQRRRNDSSEHGDYAVFHLYRRRC